MLWYLYRAAVRLHPRAFRSRFGDEMLSIFESTRRTSSRFGLLCDCLVSCMRQWILRSDFRSESARVVPAADGIPSFASLDGFRPRTSAVFDGIVLSAALFVLTCFAIRYSWIRILHVQIPEYQSYLGINVAKSPGELRGTHRPEPQKLPHTDSQSGLISEQLQVDVMPVEEGPAVSQSPITREPAESAPRRPQIAGVEMTLQPPLDLYAGTYESRSPRMTIKIVARNGQLSMQVAGESLRRLSPVSESEFVIAGSEDGRIEFLPAQNGDIVRLRLSRHGQQITAERQ